MSQLELLFGRVLTLPDGEEFVEDRDAPAHPGCPGCLLFGCCALHDERRETA